MMYYISFDNVFSDLLQRSAEVVDMYAIGANQCKEISRGQLAPAAKFVLKGSWCQRQTITRLSVCWLECGCVLTIYVETMLLKKEHFVSLGLTGI